MNQSYSSALRRTSFTLFAVSATIYLLAWLLAANDVVPAVTKMIASYADLPTFFTGLVFLTTRLIDGLDLTTDEAAPTRVALWIITFALLAGITILDLFAAA